MCHRTKGIGPCDCCPSCGDHRFTVKDRRCMTCFPHSKDAPVVKQKQSKTLTDTSGRLLSIKPGKSRAAEAIRREQLYREAQGLGSINDDDITHA